MPKAPAFQLYSADFLVDTMDWSIEEVGIYARLLFYQWTNGSIPNDEKRLARIAGCDLKKFQKYFQKVVCKFKSTDPNNLQNLRLEEEREKQNKYSESRRKIANKRWDKTDAYASDMHEPTQCIDDALQSSSSFKEKNIIKKEKTRQQKLTDEEYFLALKNNPAYHTIDIEREKGKCEAWCLSHNSSFTRKRFVNWLNRVDVPLNGNGAKPTYGLSPDTEKRLRQIEEEEKLREARSG